MDDMTFDESVFYETERRLDLLNGLKAKYGQRSEEIREYQKKQQEKLNKLQKYEEIFEASREELKKAEHACKKIQAYKHYSNGCRNALQETICRATVMSSYDRSRQSPALPPFL